MKKIYEEYMRKCFKLALLADGKTSPNPLVGCVVLDKYGEVISTGYHHKCGENHAERDALLKLENDEARGGTLIVNLEPCSHFGKTPPCADLIVEKGLKTVVYGMKDVNPLVAGRGLKKCENAGIKIIGPVLEEEALKLNEVFIKNMQEKSTFVAIKSASTIDGKIATYNGDSKWITSSSARDEVQKIRNRYDAIMTTSSTVIADNPSMTCRLKNGKKLTKIILDRTLRTDFKSNIYNSTGEKIYVVVDEKLSDEKLKAVPENIEVIKNSVKDGKLEVSKLLKSLYNLGIMSVLIEAGGNFCGNIIENGLVDKIYQFIAPKILSDSLAQNSYNGEVKEKISQAKEFKIEKIENFAPDILITLNK
ncbi:bifunctional diaminohydroxyphosphoribosylaminopyrimidine deaminase/5-amino-6-(5-phosphoribosylamino)uracil reductase RibD [bacterium]|nr:bifunctional diaminohydroxyphosphoribosylaminopyrimidine deaminase/5-amino-6-(5-phosphoribosylamino)uracil reductase RibD [bacterium]